MLASVVPKGAETGGIAWLALRRGVLCGHLARLSAASRPPWQRNGNTSPPESRPPPSAGTDLRSTHGGRSGTLPADRYAARVGPTTRARGQAPRERGGGGRSAAMLASPRSFSVMLDARRQGGKDIAANSSMGNLAVMKRGEPQPAPCVNWFTAQLQRFGVRSFIQDRDITFSDVRGPGNA
jgi:hypothetical protein